ncbi:MAG: hypothetical protein FWE74_10010 [Oscillospiraceae bacterium]|nr:hypothetical protein [Oscillospiraceae bacterium]
MFIIKKRFKEPNILKPIRFNEELLERMMKLKEKYGVSFNSIVLQCCEYALDNFKEKSGET